MIRTLTDFSYTQGGQNKTKTKGIRLQESWKHTFTHEYSIDTYVLRVLLLLLVLTQLFRELRINGCERSSLKKTSMSPSPKSLEHSGRGAEI